MKLEQALKYFKILEIKDSYIISDKTRTNNETSKICEIPKYINGKITNIDIKKYNENDSFELKNQNITLEEAEEKYNVTYQEKYYVLKAYIGNKDTVIIPGNIDNYEVILDNNLFEYNEKIKEVIIEEDLIYISKNCFYNSSIEKITLPKSLYLIKASAFQSCKKLTKINLENVKRMGPRAFTDSGIKEIDLANVEFLNECLYENCVNLKKVILSDKITTIPIYCFAGTKITEIDLKNVKEIYDYAFSECEKLENIISDKITRIKFGAFFNCNNLMNINLENVKKMEMLAFGLCLKLNKININNIKSLSRNTFKDSNINTINFNSECKINMRAFNNCNINNININTAITLSERSFADCEINNININYKDAVINGNTFCENTCIYNFNIYEKTTIKKPYTKNNIILNSYTGDKYEDFICNFEQNFASLKDLDFSLSRINLLLKAQNDNLLLYLINENYSEDILRSIIDINKQNSLYANKIKYICLTNEFSETIKSQVEDLIKPFLNNQK